LAFVKFWASDPWMLGLKTAVPVACTMMARNTAW